MFILNVFHNVHSITYLKNRLLMICFVVFYVFFFYVYILKLFNHSDAFRLQRIFLSSMITELLHPLHSQRKIIIMSGNMYIYIFGYFWYCSTVISLNIIKVIATQFQYENIIYRFNLKTSRPYGDCFSYWIARLIWFRGNM